MFDNLKARSIRSHLKTFAIAILTVTIATLFKLTIDPTIKIESPFMLFLAAVIVSSWYGGWKAGTLATLFGALITDYLFLTPNYFWLNNTPGENLRLAMFVAEAILISRIISGYQNYIHRIKLSEKALRESQERYRLLIDAVEDYAIFMLDPDGYVTTWNTGAQKFKGYQASEIIGRHFSCFYPQEQIEKNIPQLLLQQAAATGKATTEGWRVRKDGSQFWAHVVMTPLRDEAGNLKGFSKVSHDLTHSKKQEVALRESEERFRTLADNISQLAWMADPTGAIFWYNQRWFDYTGTAWEEMQGWGWQQVHHADHLPRVVEKFRSAIQSGETWEDTFPLRGQDGQFRWFLSRAMPIRDEDGNILRWFGTNTDIQDLKLAEEALRQEEERFRVTFSQAPVGIAHLNLNSRPLLVNQKLCEILGYTETELLNLNVADISYSEDQEIDLNNFQKLLNGEITSYSMEKRYIRKDQSIVWSNLTVSLVLETSANKGEKLPDIQYVIGIVEDITQRKQTEASLQSKTQEITTILNSITDAFVNLDTEWNYTYVNPKAEELLGKQKQELLGNNVWDIFPDAINLPGYPYSQQAVEKQITLEYEEYNFILKKWLAVRLYPSVQGLAIYFQDITERKQAEIALQRSEERYRSLVAATSQIVWIVDAQGMTIDIPSWRAYTGQTVEEVRGLGWLNALHPEDREYTAEQWADAVAYKIPYEGEYRLRSKEGIYRYFSVRGVPVLEADGSVREWIGACTDIDDHKRFEEAVQAKNNQIATIFASITDAFVSLDRQFHCIYVNRKAEEILGKPKRELLSQCIWDVFPELTDLPCYNHLHQALNEQISLEYENYFPNFDKWLSVRLYPSPQGLSIYLLDITQRKQTEEQLRLSEAKFRRLADSNVVGIITTNYRGEITQANDAFLEMLGYTQEDLNAYNINWRNLTPPEYLPEDERIWNEQINKIGTFTSYEKEFFRIDGSRVPILAAGALLEDTEQSVICIILDLSDRKQVEIEREQLLKREQAAREEAETASRMKDEFLATLSHELRTPMNAMLGWASLLRNRKLNETSTARALETIERNTRLLNQLIEDILDVSRIVRGKVHLHLQSVRLISAIEAAMETVRSAAEAKDLEMRLEPSETSTLTVLGDHSRLQQIIWNLLSNAIKFTPEGGRVTVRLAVATHAQISRQEDKQTTGQADEAVSPSCPLEIEYAQIIVSDTGIGIKPEFLPFVFERFRQADSSITRSHGGLGLGLAIVRQLVELHGGSVEAYSPGANQGATFIVNLPLKTQQKRPQKELSADPLQPPSAVREQSLNHLQVLVVDDELDVRELVKVILEGCGANVTTVASVKEALEAFSTLPVDVIVSDIGMPESNGYTLIQQIRKKSNIPAIALSAYASADDQNKALEAGFQRHIAKPVNPTELIKAIANLVQSVISNQ